MQIFEYHDKIPTKWLYRKCYRIAIKFWFEVFYSCVICVNLLLVIVQAQSAYVGILNYIDLMFFLMFTFEFIIKWFSYTTSNLKQGFIEYWGNFWNKIDFCVLMIGGVHLTIIIMVEIYLESFTSISNSAKHIYEIKYIRLLRILRVLKLIFRMSSKLIDYWSKALDKKYEYAYSIGQALVIGYEDVLDVLPRLSTNISIRQTIKKILIEDKLATLEKIGYLDSERPWIGIKVRTRQAVIGCIKSMTITVDELKSTGLVDDYEYSRLKACLAEANDDIIAMKYISNVSPKNVLEEVPWLTGKPLVDDILKDNVTSKIFDKDEVLIQGGQVVDGVYVLITGFCKLVYQPNTQVLENMANYGQLPARDILGLEFENPEEEYVMKGFTLGELSIITGRASNTTVIACTPAQALIIPARFLRQALNYSEDPVNGLTCLMWKACVLDMVRKILSETHGYQLLTVDQMNMVLNRSFVPNLKCFKLFVLTELVQDIILLDGQLVDYNTNEIYTAPCHVPRNVQKLMLPGSSKITLKHNTQTKIMIIPIKDVDEYDVVIFSEYLSELVDNHDSECMMHGDFHKPQVDNTKKTYAHAGGVFMSASIASTHTNAMVSSLSKVASTWSASRSQSTRRMNKSTKSLNQSEQQF